MKHYKRITFGVLLLQLVLILVVIFFFRVDNMTLGQGVFSVSGTEFSTMLGLSVPIRHESLMNSCGSAW